MYSVYDVLKDIRIEDIDGMIRYCGEPIVNPFDVLVTREAYQPGYLSAAK